MTYHQPAARIRLPELYPAQEIFGFWDVVNPQAQVLVAPCGTKVGKSFSSSVWLVKQALEKKNFCVWIAPTYLKAKIGYRYCKSFLPVIKDIECIDGLLEIRISNGSFIKFLHGSDSETTIEGEAIERFIIDETGKMKAQAWYSLLTTLTQTRGKGIVTGTPRGFTWYYDAYRKAVDGDPFFAHVTLKTSDSPYVAKEAIDAAKKLLPPSLFQQYYEAKFISGGEVFGDLLPLWDESLKVEGNPTLWIHPNEEARSLDTVTGWDVAKANDYSVFTTVNSRGQLVGYVRMRHVNYDQQVDRLKIYLDKYFHGDKSLRYDATGVGNAIGELLSAKDIDANITAVTFTNQSKQEMISRTIMAFNSRWFRAPRIQELEHELGSFELKTTRSGLFSYSAPEGEHDDIVCSLILAVSAAYQHENAAKLDDLLIKINSGKLFKETYKPKSTLDKISEYCSDGFFDRDDEDFEDDDDGAGISLDD